MSWWYCKLWNWEVYNFFLNCCPSHVIEMMSTERNIMNFPRNFVLLQHQFLDNLCMLGVPEEEFFTFLFFLRDLSQDWIIIQTTNKISYSDIALKLEFLIILLTCCNMKRVFALYQSFSDCFTSHYFQLSFSSKKLIRFDGLFVLSN